MRLLLLIIATLVLAGSVMVVVVDMGATPGLWRILLFWIPISIVLFILAARIKPKS